MELDEVADLVGEDHRGSSLVRRCFRLIGEVDGGRRNADQAKEEGFVRDADGSR